jgi:hypothetical protein
MSHLLDQIKHNITLVSGILTPSALDYKSWSKIHINNENVVLIIVGQHSLWVATKAQSTFDLLTEVKHTL